MRIREFTIKFQNCPQLLLLLATVLFLNGQMRAQGQGPAGSPSNANNYIAVGTLAYHLSTNAVGHARGRSATVEDLRIFSNWHYAEYSGTNFPLLTNITWSTNFWLHGVQGLSATAVGYSNGLAAQSVVTMVSPRHYLFAAHQHPEGYLIAFLDTNNVFYWRKTLQRIDLTSDTAVGILNADLPPSVGFLPVLPANFSEYLPTNLPVPIQGLGMNQDALIFGQPMTFGFPPLVGWSPVMRTPFGLGTNWNRSLRGGDSSNPDMLLIGNQLVLVSHNFGVQAGPNYALQLNAINEAMHLLSIHNRARSDYQLTTFPLTDWPKVR